jgi:DNA invertase Pin-like site-specific DNA recombinase
MSSLKPAPFHVLIMSEESRLGREQIDVMYALKQLIKANVRIFFYLDDRERTLDNPVEKAMLSLQTMADEMEREKARQRTSDAMIRKARAGHVTGGRVFGYDNIPVDGHVERIVNKQEAAVIRRIFELSAKGLGRIAITKQLNAEGAPAPRPQQGRPQGWASSSIHVVLHGISTGASRRGTRPANVIAGAKESRRPGPNPTGCACPCRSSASCPMTSGSRPTRAWHSRVSPTCEPPGASCGAVP